MFAEPRRVAEDRRDCDRMYVVTKCATTPVLYGNRNGSRTIYWHEVTSLANEYVTVDGEKRPMGFSERSQAPFTGTP
jgi:hypothetical protein